MFINLVIPLETVCFHTDVQKVHNAFRIKTSIVSFSFGLFLSPLTFDAPQRSKNSTEAKNVLENVNVPVSHILVLFDVKSLFTSIPIKLTLESVEDMIKNNPKLKRNLIRKAL